MSTGEDAILDTLHLCIAGSGDFVRRMAAASRRAVIPGLRQGVSVTSGNLIETKSLALTHRPQVLLLDVGFKTTWQDVVWLRTLLSELRERFQRKLYIIVAVTSPEKFVHAGTLLFANDHSLEPSATIDNLLIAPPPGIASVLSLEDQLVDCLTYVAELLADHPDSGVGLPALWEEAWTPTMCDPESRKVWMRWLPRYARYVNENPMIVGPTGSGKTRLAAALHALSGRSGPFISITPRDFSSTELVQAELFGAVPGAYTGAVEKWGLVKKADKGTLFIDELQSIDFDLQGKLITFIENKTYRRVGEAESHHADVRFIFASNRSLQSLVEEGRLRDDFAYRLERLQLTLGPLHQRRLDIAAAIPFALARVLRERLRARGAVEDGTLRPGASPHLEGLQPGAYRKVFGALWPGNLRQLENSMAKMIEIATIRKRHFIDEHAVEEALQGLLGQTALSSSEIFMEAAQAVAREAEAEQCTTLQHCSIRLLEHSRRIALERTGGNIEEAAALLDDSPKALELFYASRAAS